MRFNSKYYPLLTKENWFSFEVHPTIFPGNSDGKMGYVEFERKTKSWGQALCREIAKNTRLCYVSNVLKDAAIDNYPKLIDSVLEFAGQQYFLIENGVIRIGVIGQVDFLIKGKYLVGLRALSPDKQDFVFYNNRIGDLETCYSDFTAIPAAILLFKKYSSVETKTLPPRRKVFDFHCRYKSDLDIPIDLYTENWYTESCQTHPFVVRGHWRVQPCGKGLKDKKVIWIDKFMKKGYKKGAFKEKY